MRTHLVRLGCISLFSGSVSSSRQDARGGALLAGGVCYFSEEAQGNVCVPAGTHIVMVGDSTMMYQYISLAYALGHGVEAQEPISLAGGPPRSLANQFTWETYRSFMSESSQLLHDGGSSERCDCFFGDPDDGSLTQVTDNRFFERAGVRLSFFQLLGRRSMNGTWLPGQPASNAALHDHFSPSWVAPTPWSFLKQLLPRFEPTVLVLNTGIHLMTPTSGQPLSPNEWDLLENATAHLQPNVYWRTTQQPPFEGMASSFPAMTRKYIEAEAEQASRHGFRVFDAHNHTRAFPADNFWSCNKGRVCTPNTTGDCLHVNQKGNNVLNWHLIQRITATS